MPININREFLKKANALKKPLKEKTVKPQRYVEFAKCENAFQNLAVVDKGEFSLPLVLTSGDKILVDFGQHYTGYLGITLDNFGDRICDSPVKLKFTFGEFPYEILKPEEEYCGDLGNCWFQREERLFATMPAQILLERRYAFRYLMIERLDNADFSVVLKALYAKSVSAVDMDEFSPIEINDDRLKRIYMASVRTLKECQQDVFEDGPKRDRRLWLGDLKVQAITDYKTFKNYDLVKRSLYLLAAARCECNLVSSCLFSESYPYIDDKPDWIYTDYCLFFISCLYDYHKETGDLEFVRELFGVARQQAELVCRIAKGEHELELHPFIDWCPGLDKEVAFWGVYVYALKQFCQLADVLGEDCAKEKEEIKTAIEFLLGCYDQKLGFFVTKGGQISQHSQIWGVLSGVLPMEKSAELVCKIEELNTEYTMRTPFAVHYYLEALFGCGMNEKAIDVIRDYWGKILDCGYDCCPECFNENNDFESPYNAPELNSSCHAWSCTPAYWIDRYIKEK